MEWPRKEVILARSFKVNRLLQLTFPPSLRTDLMWDQPLPVCSVAFLFYLPPSHSHSPPSSLPPFFKQLCDDKKTMSIKYSCELIFPKCLTSIPRTVSMQITSSAKLAQKIYSPYTYATYEFRKTCSKNIFTIQWMYVDESYYYDFSLSSLSTSLSLSQFISVA